MFVLLRCCVVCAAGWLEKGSHMSPVCFVTPQPPQPTPPGPAIVPRIKQELAACLARDGFGSVEEAVGADHRGGKRKR